MPGCRSFPSFQAPDAATLAREAPQAAERLGYPVLVKAAAGGGGKGMRVVGHAEALPAALEAGAREAQQAFGDPTLLLEKYIDRPRHVEVQVLGDRFGSRVHLFERECSIQRRHQKIVEETPSPAVDADLRQRMTDAALRLADAVDYTSAGTVEFLLAPDGSFYFLEMNTRLQVEHAITEQVSGVDLVHQQLRIAGGEPLPFTQAQLTQRGHAIECRLYAENPATGFLPATGRVGVLREPHGPGCRIDSGLAPDQEITPALRSDSGEAHHPRRHAAGGTAAHARSAARLRHSRPDHQPRVSARRDRVGSVHRRGTPTRHSLNGISLAGSPPPPCRRTCWHWPRSAICCSAKTARLRPLRDSGAPAKSP